MFDLLTNALALVFVLGVMIFVHELGHFATAKFFGIYVEVFALGFGPRLFGFRRGDTDYRVCALPLGGYVKMKGENPDEEITGDDDEFLSRPKWQRFFVLFNGPLMNVALAFVLLTMVFMRGMAVDAYQNEPADIGLIGPDTPAAEAGLLTGDRVIAMDGDPVETWQEFQLQVLISGGQEVEMTVERAGREMTLSATPDAVGPSRQGSLGEVYPLIEPLVAEVVEDTPAERAGLQRGDRFIEAEGVPILDWLQLTSIIEDRAGQETTIAVERDGARVDMVVTPELATREAAGGVTEEYGAMGVLRPPNETELISFSFVPAMGRALTEMRSQTALVGEILERLFTGRMSMRSLSGPIEIARYSGAAARTADPFMLFYFMAVVSLQLGLLNLLPIPVLDGGHIAVLAFEGITRHDLSMQVKENMMKVGVVLLVTLMLVVITFDILKSFGS